MKKARIVCFGGVIITMIFIAYQYGQLKRPVIVTVAVDPLSTTVSNRPPPEYTLQIGSATVD